MWEQIRSNKRKSVLLVFVMGFLLVILGFAIGEAIAPGAGPIGLGVAALIWFFMSLISYAQGDNILLALSGAQAIEKGDHPQLFNVVEEMTIAAGLPKMPSVHIIDDPAPNAFATGRSPDHSAVAVTSGLLTRLNRDQLQGVIAHEMSHVINRDVLFMTMIGVMVGAIVMISEIFLRGLFRGSRYRSSRREGGAGGGVMIIVAIVLAILAPLLARFIYFAASRRREYLADSNAAVLTRYPEGLASALDVIASSDARSLASANRATAPMYIINPLQAQGGPEGVMGLFSTHPPTMERIRILRSMAGVATFAEYQRAWNARLAGKGGRLPASALARTDAQPIRAAHPDAAQQLDPRQQLRQVGDALRSASQFAFLSCQCGLRIKLPPNFAQDHVACPRCHRELSIPVAQSLATGQLADTLSDAALPGAGAPPPLPSQTLPPLTANLASDGWTSVKCSCGAIVNLSPACAATHVACRKCGRQINISPAQ